MANVQDNIKKWISLISSQELKHVIMEIQESNLIPSDALNKYIFKMLLYLSHAADKCNKENCAKGEEIFKLACILCSLMTQIPDCSKFFSSMYHIIRCLLTMHKYERASETSRLLFKRMVDCNTSISESVTKIFSLWQYAITNITEKLRLSPKNNDYNMKLKLAIKCQLDAIEKMYVNYEIYILAAICSHLSNIIVIYKNVNNLFENFCEHIISYLKTKRMILTCDHKYTIYQHIIDILRLIIKESLIRKNIKFLENIVDDIWKYFNPMILDENDCYDCLYEFKSVCLLIVQPVKNLVLEKTDEMQSCITRFMKTMKKYQHPKLLKPNIMALIGILELAISSWEEVFKEKMFETTDYNFIIKLMKFTEYLGNNCAKQPIEKCKNCLPEKCSVKYDIFNAIVIQTKSIDLLCRSSSKEFPEEVCIQARKLLEKNISQIDQLFKLGCSRWKQLWSTCGILIYNLGLFSENYCNESVTLFSLLCSSIIHFEGLGSISTYLCLENPLSHSLHRMSNVYYKHAMYRQALTASALNGLLSYDNPKSKAFRMWASIKHKCSEVRELTMIACLIEDKEKIKDIGLNVDLSNYNLVHLCLQEAKGLQAAKVNLDTALYAVLKELKLLKANSADYGLVILYLGYHLLQFEDNSDISKFVDNSIKQLQKEKCYSLYTPCIEINLRFFKFIQKLQSISNETKLEMTNVKSNTNETDAQEDPQTLIPAFSMINIATDSELMMELYKVLCSWKKYLTKYIDEMINYEPDMTLKIIIVAGEYSRLLRYEKCEILAWNIAYKLAEKLKNYSSMIYVTARSVSLRNFNWAWIETSEKLSNELKQSQDQDTLNNIVIFWIYLSDFYFECGKLNEARKLLDAARSFPGVSLVKNTFIYLLSLDTIIRNCLLYMEDIKHEDYSRYIIESLYSVTIIQENINKTTGDAPDKRLLRYDIIFSSLVNLSLRINCLTSFREISAYLYRRLETAQTMGLAMRVAELQKSLCLIDLSRFRLDECEAKLQGLEKLLAIETGDVSQAINIQSIKLEELTITDNKVVDSFRDSRRSVSSPILRKRSFITPDFLSHFNCNCYSCENISYQYLIFTCTYIRAQLFALQEQINISTLYFHGAFKIRRKIFNGEKELINLEGKKEVQKLTKQVFWQTRFYIVDYIHLLIDYTCFLKKHFKNKNEEILNLALTAVNVCKKYKLQSHPIYISSEELVFDLRLQCIRHKIPNFRVPDPSTIDISKYSSTGQLDKEICVTPVVSNNVTRRKKTAVIRKNKSPPLIKPTQIGMNLVEDEISSAATPSIQEKSQPQGRQTRSRTRLTRRKILDEEYMES